VPGSLRPNVTKLSKLPLRHLANSWNAADKHGRKEILDLGGLDHEQTVRITSIGGIFARNLLGATQAEAVRLALRGFAAGCCWQPWWLWQARSCFL
jgi:hypothetical protein